MLRRDYFVWVRLNNPLNYIEAYYSDLDLYGSTLFDILLTTTALPDVLNVAYFALYL